MKSFNQPPHGSTLQGWMRRNNEAGHFFSQQEKAAEAKATQPVSPPSSAKRSRLARWLEFFLRKS
jgi:hypothetical protein